MAYRPQSSFSAGELDPSLFERTDLDKYRSGLQALRNSFVGKTGRIISRPGTQFQFETKFPNLPSVIYSPPYTPYIIEWGIGYVRIHDTTEGTFTDDPHDWGPDQLPNLQFAVTEGLFVYIFATGFPVKRMYLKSMLTAIPPFNERFATTAEIFLLPPAPTFDSGTTSGTGYNVDYAVSYIIGGLESDYVELIQGVGGVTAWKLPINNGEQNTVEVDLPVDPSMPLTPYANISAINIYRRPTLGSAYGFVGSSPTNGLSAAVFTDVGGAADYTHSPPIPINIGPRPPHSNPIKAITSKTGAIYQQRLLVTDDKNTEAVYGSRTGFQNSFFEETTLTPDSAVAFKSGSTGSANVLKLYDSLYGLLVFTTIGVYQNTGALEFSNLALNKVTTMVIQDNVPPIDVPGGMMAIDKATNSVQSLIYSYVEQTFPPDEVSLYSNHLFRGKQVVSWAFQDGDTPLVWVIFNDGSLVSLSYKREQQLRAWSRHDSDSALFEYVTVQKDLNAQSVVYFQVNRNGVRSIESLAPRYAHFVNGTAFDPNDIKNFICMDSAVTFKNDLGAAAGGAVFTITAEDNTNWAGLLYINSSVGAFANIAGQGAPGDIFRFFDSQGAAVDLQVQTFVNGSELIVQPMNGLEFPEDQGVGAILYGTFSTLTGLDHLDGQTVSILVDGYVEASPNNNIELYNFYVVENGTITLANGKLGAIIHVGLPFTSDVQTLDLDTVEQKPTLLESKIVNKVWVKVLHSRGLYVSGQEEFPENDTVGDMTDIETLQETELGITGNRAQPPITRRYDIAIRNDWHSNGRICLRQVDPLPFEILSIIPDLQVWV